MRIAFFVFLLTLVGFACKKEQNTGYDTRFRGSMSLEFDNVVGTDDLRLTTGSYTNASGETYTVRALRYFISNIVLTNTNGTDYVVPQDSSYFLIDESMAASKPSLKIPEGEYNQLKFTLGVDSLRSTMPLSQRLGVLAPSVSTYLDENSGYVFSVWKGIHNRPPTTGMTLKLQATVVNLHPLSIISGIFLSTLPRAVSSK